MQLFLLLTICLVVVGGVSQTTRVHEFEEFADKNEGLSVIRRGDNSTNVGVPTTELSMENSDTDDSNGKLNHDSIIYSSGKQRERFRYRENKNRKGAASSVGSRQIVSVSKVSNGGRTNHDSVKFVKANNPCVMNVSQMSVEYFWSRLKSSDPHFVHFELQFYNEAGEYIHYNATPDTFLANKWVWTYWSPSGLYPYLSWNIDYSVLSFGLLDSKTLMKVRGYSEMFVRIDVAGDCNITFGVKDTTNSIANALRSMTAKIVAEGTESNPEYDESYYCFLAEAPGARETFAYQAAVYFMFPISYINYNCCITNHNYTTKSFTIKCPDEQIQKWTQCILGPFIIGFIMFLFYNPILMFKMAAWLSSDEDILPSDYEMAESLNAEEPAVLISYEGIAQDKDWVFLNGESPYKITDLMSKLWCGANKRWPSVVSRIRRLIFFLMLPIGIYVKVLVYRYTMYDNVRLLLKHGTPMGFLSLLGENGDRKNAFATYFGGPIIMLMVYYIVGFIFLVVPRSVKQIIEDGMPKPNNNFKTPVVLSISEVKRLSMVDKPLEPGYMKGVTFFICGMYMVFSKEFWVWVFKTQSDRVKLHQRKPTLCIHILKLVSMPFYFLFCLFEIVIAVLVHGVPFIMFLFIVLRGVTRSLIGFRVYILQFCHNIIIRKLILNNPIVGLVIFFATSVMLILFAYAICLIFIDTFNFISEVVVYCFVAVIVFPSVAFGYLFFFVVLLYYIVRLIRDFDDSYIDLLSETVDISRNLDGHPNYVTFFGNEMIVSNLKVPVGIKRIRLNNTPVEVAQNIFQSISNESDQQKVKLKNHKYAIPRDLFEFLIKKHRPAHQKLLKIFLHIVFIVVLIWLTISISSKYVSGPSSEISEVMHVIFLVAVGALPRILEVAMMTASVNIKKDIELRRLEESIVQYWNDQNLDI